MARLFRPIISYFQSFEKNNLMISNFYFWGWIHNFIFLLENFRYVATKKTQKKRKKESARHD